MNVLERKELLYYLLFTEGDEKLSKDRDAFIEAIGLSDAELSDLKTCAVTTRALISYVDYHIDETAKRNQDISDILAGNSRQVALVLGEKEPAYEKWMLDWWEAERKYRKNFISPKDSSSVSVYATQYDAETSNEVALPDQYIKFATRGWTSNIPVNLRTIYSGSYSVSVTYGQTTKSSVPVYDVGPWNTNDNYWDASNGTNPRRAFTDLDRYEPEAYAAFYDNYNGGKDSRGRDVTNPAGIDLCLTVAKALGFSKNGSGWVTVNMSSLP